MTQADINKQLLQKIADLEAKIKGYDRMYSNYYKTHFIDKDVFYNPVYFQQFIILPKVLAAPTTVPTNTEDPRMVYDVTNHKIWVYDAGWKSVVLT